MKPQGGPSDKTAAVGQGRATVWSGHEVNMRLAFCSKLGAELSLRVRQDKRRTFDWRKSWGTHLK